MKGVIAFEAILIAVITAMTIKIFPEFLEALEDIKETFWGERK